MKFTIQQKIINKAISKIIGIVDKKCVIPFLSNIKIDVKDNTISITGTDMDIFIEGNINSSDFVKIEEIGHTTVQAHILHEKLKEVGFEPLNDKPFYNEFVVKTPKPPEEILSSLLKKNILGGINLGENKLLVCCTENNSAQDIEDYVSAVNG